MPLIMMHCFNPSLSFRAMIDVIILNVHLTKLCVSVSVLQLGECVAAQANPAAEIFWLKNKQPLVSDDKSELIY